MSNLSFDGNAFIEYNLIGIILPKGRKMKMIYLENVSKVYPNGTEALKNISLNIDNGEFVFIVGPSVCEFKY